MAKRKRTSEPRRTSGAGVATRSTSGRVTRDFVRRNNVRLADPVDDPEPRKRRKTKTEASVSEVKQETEPESEEEAAPTQAGQASASEPNVVDGGSKKIIIEHGTQGNSFKTKAAEVKNALEKEVAGVNVVVNPEKPRKGCFEIREEGGEVFVSLLDLKKPFKPLLDLDMEEVITGIIEKIK